MGDAQPTLLPPSSGTFTPATPSGLTPNTRSEAEAALTHNITTQTDSAAPTTPLPTGAHNMYPYMGAGGGNTLEGEADGVDEAQRAYRRPAGPLRTSSTHYEAALREARKQSSASSNLSADTSPTSPTNILGEGKVASPITSTIPFPPPGQGVVPLHSGVGAGQTEAVKKARPHGLSLGHLGRQPSWSEQDMKHIYTAGLMAKVEGDAGYASGAEGKEN